MTSPKGHDDLPVTCPKHVEICDLPKKEFKAAVLRRPNEVQEDTEKQFSEIRKTINRQHEKLEVEIIKNKTKKKF